MSAATPAGAEAVAAPAGAEARAPPIADMSTVAPIAAMSAATPAGAEAGAGAMKRGITYTTARWMVGLDITMTGNRKKQ